MLDSIDSQCHICLSLTSHQYLTTRISPVYTQGLNMESTVIKMVKTTSDIITFPVFSLLVVSFFIIVSMVY